jgi:hypothetical protein
MSRDRGDREQALTEREETLHRREVALARRREATAGILAVADERDADADLRDDVSAERDHAADLDAFVRPDDESYGSDHPERRHAALDRIHAKDDCASSADDRRALAEDTDVDPEEAGSR